MSSIFFASLAGSPGVTTTAVGLTLNWPRPAILLEVDTSRSSSVLPGYLRGQVDHSLGLTPLSVSHQRGQLNVEALWAQTVQLAEERYLVPGFSNLAAAHGTTSLWGALGSLLASLENAGIDVLIDAGRLEVNDPRIPLLQQADSVVVLARPVLPDIAAVAARLPELRLALGAVAHESYLSVALVDSEYESYSSSEISRALGAPVVTRFKWDARTAALFSLGADRQPRFDKSPLRHTLITAASTLRQDIADRANALGFQPMTSENEGELA